MKFLSWNVNGLRASLKKGFEEKIEELDYDFVCLQETKMQESDAVINLENYEKFFNSAVKKGYSGTAIFTKHKPINVSYGIDIQEHDQEGRVITLEYEKFYLITVYTPNVKRELTRLDYRMNWEDDFRKYVKKLDENKPCIICGDLNVAHEEIDIHNAKSNIGNAGFTNEERNKMSEFLKSGFTDSFRFKNPDCNDGFTWWSYRFNARERNIGWRLDYFLVSDRIKDKIIDANILKYLDGSDHCPVGIDLDL